MGLVASVIPLCDINVCRATCNENFNSTSAFSSDLNITRSERTAKVTSQLSFHKKREKERERDVFEGEIFN